MAFTSKGSIGATGNTSANQSSIVLTTTAAVGVGDLVVVLVAVDNTGTTDADHSEISSVTDNDSNTWRKALEWTNGQGTAQTGATISMWWSIITTAKASSRTITANFTTSTSADAQAISAWAWSKDQKYVEIIATNTGQTDGGDPAALDAATANVSALRIRGIAGEVGGTTALTVTGAGWNAFDSGNSAASGTTGEQSVRGEWKISTGTGDSSNPSWVSCDNASVYVAFINTDGNDFFTKALLHMDGANGSSTFTDSSASARDFSQAGGSPPTIATAQSKFGGSSGSFPTSDNYIREQTGDADWGLGTGEFTIDFWIRFSTVGRVVLAEASVTNGFVLEYTHSSTQLKWGRNGVAFDLTPTWAPSADTWYHVAVERYGTTVRIYVDGTSIGSGTLSTDYQAGDINVGYTAGGVHFIDEFRFTKGQARYRGVNFTPPTWPYSFRGVVAEAGTFSLTGTAATLLHKWKLAADAGSYALTGTAATLRRNLPLVAGAGSYALTGTTATPKHGWKIAGGAGSFALSGTAASLLQARKLAAAAGAFALTGTDATLRRNLPLAAGDGSYALTGSAAALLHAWRVTAGAGSYALTGSDATLRRNLPLIAVAGSFALTGSDATLRRNLPLAAGAGSYALSGTAASLLQARKIDAGAGSFLLTGSDAGLIHATSGEFFLSADAGAFALTGTAASLSAARKAVAEAGAYSLSGTAASLLAARKAAAGAGSFALSGVDAALLRAQKVIAGEGMYSLAGVDATLRATLKVSAAAGAFALSGSPATMVNSGDLIIRSREERLANMLDRVSRFDSGGHRNSAIANSQPRIGRLP